MPIFVHHWFVQKKQHLLKLYLPIFFKGCPYFRTPDNFNLCQILTHAEAEWRREEEEKRGKGAGTTFGSRAADLYATTSVIVGIALLSVLTLGTFFYRRGKKVCVPNFWSCKIEEKETSHEYVVLYKHRWIRSLEKHCFLTQT
jgi:hypothetical protein